VYRFPASCYLLGRRKDEKIAAFKFTIYTSTLKLSRCQSSGAIPYKMRKLTVLDASVWGIKIKERDEAVAKLR